MKILAFKNLTDLKDYVENYKVDENYTEILTVQYLYKEDKVGINFILTTNLDKIKLATKNIRFTASFIYFKDNNWNEFETTLNSRYLFEFITNENRKLYFDLDSFKYEPIDETKFNEILNKLHEKIELLLGQKINNPNIYIRKTKENKINSSHIIYPNISMNYIQQKKLADQLNIDLKHEYLDTSIYSKTRQFNLPNKTKIQYGDDDRSLFVKYKINDEDKNSFFVNDTINTELIIYEKELQEPSVDITTDGNLNNLINILPLEFYTNRFYWKLLTKKILENDKLDIYTWLNHSSSVINKNYTTDEINEFVAKLYNFNSNNYNIVKMIKNKYGISFTGLDIIDNQRLEWIKYNTDLEVNYILTELEKQKYKQNSTELNNNIKLGEYHYKPNNDILVSPTGSWEYYYYWLLEQKLINTNDKNFEIVEKIKSLQDIFEKNKLNPITGVKANWGSGKTFYLLNTLIHTNKDKKFILITENNTLNRETKRSLNEKFDDLTILSHLDEKYNTEADILITSLESVCKINNKLVFDYVILDEYQSIIQQFNSSTIKNKPNTFNKFYDLIKNSENILALDANLKVRSMDILNMIKKEQPKLYFCKTNNFEDYKLNFYFDKDYWYENLINDLLNNKRVILASAYKSSIIQIVNKLKTSKINTKIIIITSDTDITYHNYEITPKISKETALNNIEAFLTENSPDLFIYSPTITTGINIRSGLFDICYGFNQSRNSVIYDKFVQMLFRARKLNDKTINILTTTPTRYKQSSMFDIMYNYEKTTYDIYKRTKNDKFETTEKSLIYETLENLTKTEIKWSEKVNLQSILDLFYNNGFNINFIHRPSRNIKTEREKPTLDKLYETDFKLDIDWLDEITNSSLKPNGLHKKKFFLLTKSSLVKKNQSLWNSYNNFNSDFNNKIFKLDCKLENDMIKHHKDYENLLNSIKTVKQLPLVEPRKLFKITDFVNYYPKQELYISSDYEVITICNLNIDENRVKLIIKLDIIYEDHRPNDNLYKKIKQKETPNLVNYDVNTNLSYLDSLMKHESNLSFLKILLNDDTYYEVDNDLLTDRDKKISRKNLVLELLELMDIEIPNPHILIDPKEIFTKIENPKLLSKFINTFIEPSETEPTIEDFVKLLKSLKIFKLKNVRNTNRYFDKETYLYDYETNNRPTNTIFYNKYHSHFGLQKNYTKPKLIETRKVISGTHGKFYVMNGKLKKNVYRNKFYKNWFLDKSGSWVKKKRNDVKIVYTTRELPEFVIDEMENYELIEYYKTKVLMELMEYGHLIYNKVKYDFYKSNLEYQLYD